MHIEIRKREGEKTFTVDPVGKPGSPRIGRGRTMKEALGDFLITYQEELGIKLDVDASAWPTELRRRARELRQR